MPPSRDEEIAHAPQPHLSKRLRVQTRCPTGAEREFHLRRVSRRSSEFCRRLGKCACADSAHTPWSFRCHSRKSTANFQEWSSGTSGAAGREAGRNERRDSRQSRSGWLTGSAAASIVRGDSHAIAAAGRATPASCVVLGRVVKEGAASGVGASFYEREISVTEQIAR